MRPAKALLTSMAYQHTLAGAAYLRILTPPSITERHWLPRRISLTSEEFDAEVQVQLSWLVSTRLHDLAEDRTFNTSVIMVNTDRLYKWRCLWAGYHLFSGQRCVAACVQGSSICLTGVA
jgi:hypothetical protein